LSVSLLTSLRDMGVIRRRIKYCSMNFFITNPGCVRSEESKTQLDIVRNRRLDFSYCGSSNCFYVSESVAAAWSCAGLSASRVFSHCHLNAPTKDRKFQNWQAGRHRLAIARARVQKWAHQHSLAMMFLTSFYA